MPIVVIDDQVLEKPVNADDARVMLRLLSGREHTVITGICLLHNDGIIVDHSATQVRFAPLTEPEIADYVASGRRWKPKRLAHMRFKDWPPNLSETSAAATST